MNFYLIAAISFLSLCASAVTLNESLSPLMKTHSLFGNLILSKNIEAKGAIKKYYTLAFTSAGTKFELEAVTPTNLKEFDKTKKNLSAVIFKSYQDQPTPYEGVITNTLNCPKKFTPEDITMKLAEKEIFIVKSNVGKNYNHGICEDKLIVYSSCVSFYLDEKKSQYFKLKVFTKPKEDCLKPTKTFFEKLVDL